MSYYVLGRSRSLDTIILSPTKTNEYIKLPEAPPMSMGALEITRDKKRQKAFKEVLTTILITWCLERDVLIICS